MIFSVHKLIIQIRCPVLYNLFSSSSPNQIIKLSDISYSAFSLLMEYIYTGILPKETKLQFAFNELIGLSKRFELKLLLKLCLKPANEKLQIKSKLKFEKDISSLINQSSSLSDVKFNIIGFNNDNSKTFKLHKIILISRSEWFA